MSEVVLGNTKITKAGQISVLSFAMHLHAGRGDTLEAVLADGRVYLRKKETQP